jgi:dihydrofolate synthase/folylpolyglutamate synthase
MISHEDMIRHGEEAIQFLSSCPWVVFFDLLLAASLKYFDEQRVDYMVLESGIGGRYDSTNFIDAPAACVITSISLDHQQLLGDTVEEIAWQKAGIIKPHAHVFTPASQKPSVLQVFRDQCALMQATLHVVPVDR